MRSISSFRKSIKVVAWAAASMSLLCTSRLIAAQQSGQSEGKPRVVTTADPELDDNNTIIRAILYSSDVK